MPPDNQTQTLSLSSAPPPSVSQASGTYTGAPFRGSQPIYYWIVARYPVGLSQPFGPLKITGTPGIPGLSASNFVVISWGAVNGATSYDVLRSNTNAYPVPSSSSAISLANTGVSYTDTGGVGGAYPPVGLDLANVANASIQIDNKSQADPSLVITIDGAARSLPLIAGTTPTAGNCAQWGAGGLLTDSGAPCGSGGSSVSIVSPYLTSGASIGGPIYLITSPALPAWAWVNQGTATLTVTNGAQTIFSPAIAGVDLKLRVVAAPATPYTVTALILYSAGASANSRFGITFRESATGKLVSIALSPQVNPAVVVDRWNTATSYSATVNSVAWMIGGGFWWLRMTNDGVNIIFYVSGDGVNFYLVASEGVGAFFTVAPDQIGFLAAPANATTSGSTTLLSWSVV